MQLPSRKLGGRKFWNGSANEFRQAAPYALHEWEETGGFAKPMRDLH